MHTFATNYKWKKAHKQNHNIPHYLDSPCQKKKHSCKCQYTVFTLPSSQDTETEKGWAQQIHSEVFFPSSLEFLRFRYLLTWSKLQTSDYGICSAKKRFQHTLGCFWKINKSPQRNLITKLQVKTISWHNHDKISWPWFSMLSTKRLTWHSVIRDF